MVEDRMPKLVQTSDKLEIGTRGHFVGSNDEGITIIDREGNYDKLTTGNLHVKGNLLIDTGHVTEFDVGTAIFKDKILELGASQEITENMSHGTGIEAVNNFSPLQGVLISGLNTSTVTIEIPSMYILESRRLTIGTSDNSLNFDITSCNNTKDIYTLISADPLFNSLFTIEMNAGETQLIFKVKDKVFKYAEVDEFVGPTILRHETETYKGWVFDESIGINQRGIDNTIKNGDEDLTLTTAEGKVVRVRQGYEKDVTDDNILITKGYARLNYLSVDNLSPGLPYKGVEFVKGGYVEIDTSQNGNNGFLIQDEFTLVLPWIVIPNAPTSDVTLISFFNKASPDTTAMEVNYHNHSVVFSYYTASGNQRFYFPVGENKIVRPIVIVDSDVGLVKVYNNDVLLGSAEFNLDSRNYDTIRFGNGGVGGTYTGYMSGECVLLNYNAEEYVKVRANTDVFVPYSEQWYPFGTWSSGMLYAGHTYELEYNGGDFTMCGMKNISDEQLCTVTAMPTWGNSSVRGSGCAAYWLFTKRLDPNIDIVELAFGRHGKFVGMTYFNDPKLEQVTISSYI